MSKILKGLLLGMVASFLVVGSAAALPIFEESFEAVVPFPGHIQVDKGGTIGQFKVLDGNIDWIGTTWDASDGLNSLDMSGSQLGTIAAINLQTEIGKTYEVSFDMAGNYAGAPTIKTMYASVQPLYAAHFFQFDSTGMSSDNMGWVNKSFQFQAYATDTELRFDDMSSHDGGAFYGAALDNIVVNAVVSAPVPEPATMMLFGIGLLGLAGITRNRKKA